MYHLDELGLETLQERRSKSKLMLFYKIKNNLATEYMKTLIPDEVGENVNYELCNAREVKPPQSFLKTY